MKCKACIYRGSALFYYFLYISTLYYLSEKSEIIKKEKKIKGYDNRFFFIKTAIPAKTSSKSSLPEKKPQP